MKRRWWALTALLGSVVVVAGWITFLAVIGLDRADKLSSVVGVILATVLGVAGLVVAIRTWPHAAPSGSVGPAAPIQINQASGDATVYGVQGGNLVVGDQGASDER